MSRLTEIQDKVADKLNPERLGGMPTIITETGGGVFVPTDLAEAMELGKLMSIGTFTPPHLRGKPGDCLQVIMQAIRWGMDPFAVANKTFFVNDRLAYEAQLVIAVINTRAPLQRRLRLDWKGDGEDMKCTASGLLEGEEEPHELELCIKDVTTRNSPLWSEAPRVQMGYYTSRAWARVYVPEIIMGVYTPDEVESIRDQAISRRAITVQNGADRLDTFAQQAEAEASQEEEDRVPLYVVDSDGVVRSFDGDLEAYADALCKALDDAGDHEAVNLVWEKSRAGDVLYVMSDAERKDLVERCNETWIGRIRELDKAVEEARAAEASGQKEDKKPDDKPATADDDIAVLRENGAT